MHVNWFYAENSKHNYVYQFSRLCSVVITVHPHCPNQILDYLNPHLSEFTKRLNFFMNFIIHVICILATCMLLVLFTLTVFMLVLKLEVQKGCNGVADIA